MRPGGASRTAVPRGLANAELQPVLPEGPVDPGTPAGALSPDPVHPQPKHHEPPRSTRRIGSGRANNGNRNRKAPVTVSGVHVSHNGLSTRRRRMKNPAQRTDRMSRRQFVQVGAVGVGVLGPAAPGPAAPDRRLGAPSDQPEPSIRSVVWRANTVKSRSWWSTATSARIATAAIRQSVRLRIVSPRRRQRR